jgi:hypothetical protein
VIDGYVTGIRAIRRLGGPDIAATIRDRIEGKASRQTLTRSRLTVRKHANAISAA